MAALRSPRQKIAPLWVFTPPVALNIAAFAFETEDSQLAQESLDPMRRCPPRLLRRP